MKTLWNQLVFAVVAVMLAVTGGRTAHAQQAQLLVSQFPPMASAQSPPETTDWLKDLMRDAIQNKYVRAVSEEEWGVLVQILNREMPLEELRKDLTVYLAMLDPHSALYSPEDAARFFGRAASKISGIGVAIGPHEDDWKEEQAAIQEFYKEHAEMRLFTQDDVTRFLAQYEPLNRMTEKEAVQFIREHKMDNALSEKETEELWRLGKIASTIGEHGAVIAQVIPGSPAEIAGLKEGFLIVAVDGKDIRKMSLDDVVALIRGQTGTFVTLSIVNPKDGARTNMSIMRAPVEPLYADGKYLGNGVGYIKIVSFFGYAAEQFFDELFELQYAGATKLIIDVRGNGGGELGIVGTMLNMITPQGTALLVFRARGQIINTAWSDPNTVKFFTGPIAVLTDRNSASASEILAGALKDNGLALIVGERTYGKGTVQRVFGPLQDNSMLLLTVSTFELPSGKQIEGVGILPDIHILDDPGTHFVDEALEEAVHALTR